MRLTPMDRGLFRVKEHMLRTTKEQISRFKTRKIEEAYCFYRPNTDFLESCDSLRVEASLMGKKVPSTQERYYTTK